jgi:hypothetical protein
MKGNNWRKNIKGNNWRKNIPNNEHAFKKL